MRKFLLFAGIALLFPVSAFAQVFSQNQVIVPPYFGVLMATSSAFNAKIFASSSPTVLYMVATSTTKSNIFPNIISTNSTTTGTVYFTGSAINCNATNALTTSAAGILGCTAQPQGTVTAITIASTNGFAGSSSGGATPALTISTSISGLLKGNGTAISAASAGTDYVAPATTITINGTANQITSSAGAQDLSANRTWTLSIPNPFIISSIEAFGTSTIGDGTLKGGLTISGGATTTGSMLVLGSTTLQNFIAQNSTSSQATSSALAITSIVSCNTTNALTTNSSGSIICGSITGGASFPFTPGAPSFGQNFNSTSTLIQLNAVPVALAASGTIQAQMINTDGTLGWYQLGGQTILYASSSNGNLIVGINAGGNRATTTAGVNTNNTMIGVGAGNKLTTGLNNVAVGNGALSLQAVTGSTNVVIGQSAGANLLSGGSNTFNGNSSGAGIITGSFNSGFGASTFGGLTSGQNNLAAGYQQGKALTTGYDNIFVGQQLNTGGSDITTGGGNILIGYNAESPGSGSLLKLNIGNLLFGQIAATSSSNTVVAPTSGMFSVGSTSPFALFSIHANNGYPTSTLFAIGSSTINSTSTLFTVNQNGDTYVRGSTTLQNFTAVNSTSTQSTSTNDFATNFTCTTCFLGTLGKALNGGAFQINNILDPTSAQDAATKLYVDSAVSGTDAKDAAKYASTGALPAVIYANGSSGVGATLTGVSAGALSLDSSSPSVGDRVLIKNQVSTFQNGIYSVTTAGSGIVAFVMTRTTDFDQTADIDLGDTVFVTSGSTLANTTWVQNGTQGPVMGTDPITFSQIAGPGSLVAGSGISVSGLTISIENSGVLLPAHGGTGATSITGLVLGAGTSAWGAYAGSSCTNQFARSINGSGVLTCNAVSLTADVSGDLPFANLAQVSANSLLGNITGSTADASSVATSSIFAGTVGQNAYFSGTGLLVGTSTIFETTASFVGIASTTPWSRLSVGTGLASSSITVAEVDYGTTLFPTSTAITLDARSANQILWSLGGSATTLTICNMQPGQHLMVIIQNPNQTAGAITWATCSGSQLQWPTQTVPTQTTGANRGDDWYFTAYNGGVGSSTNAVVIRGSQVGY